MGSTSSVTSSSSTTAPAVATDTPGANTAKPDDDDDFDDDVPALEEIPDLEEMPTMDSTATTAGAPGAVVAPPRDINRAERKARRVMDKLNMKKVSGITQCILKMRNGEGGARGGAFTIAAPDCYVTSNGSSYVVFGEARQSSQDGGGVPGTDAAAAAANDSLKIEELNDNEDEEVIDESGLDQKDIDLVISQAGCSRSKAVTALKENDGDLVN